MRIGGVLPGRDDGRQRVPDQTEPGRHMPALFIPLSVLVVSQSTEPPAAEVTLVRGILLDIGGIPLFRCVGVMLMLRQLLVFQDFRIVLRAFVAAAGWGNRRFAARHDFKTPLLREIKTLRSLSYQITHRLHSPTNSLPIGVVRSQGRACPSRLVSARQEPSQNPWSEAAR